MTHTMDEIMAYFGRKLDGQQRRAMESDGNTVISAGAGSGKTTVLSFRFIRLLVENPDLHADNILAMTFTDKAAKEMKSRIGGHIKLLSEAKDAIGEETRKRFLEEWTDHFPQSQISTLDSFCSKIVRLDSLRYGLTSDFTVDEEKCKKQFRAIARSMLWHDDSEGRNTLVRLHNPNFLLEKLAKMAMEEFWLPGTMDVKTISSSFIDLLTQQLERETKGLVWFFTQIACCEAESKSESELKEFCIKALSRYDETSQVEDLIEALQQKKDGKYTYFSNVRGKGKVSQVNKEHKDQKSRWVLCIPLLRQLLDGKEKLVAVLEFLLRYQKECQAFKREQSVLCYNDLIHLAIDILTHNLGIRSYYAKQYQRIMVDEFQDNNALQKQLVYLLGSKETFVKEEIPQVEDLRDNIFLVGDEKQSIYRFRGADVSVFKQLGDELSQSGGLSLEMATNYRSEKVLIDHFTTMFQHIMASPQEDYEAIFKPLGSSRDNPGRSSLTVMVGKAEADEASESDCIPSLAGRHAWEAKAIAEKIYEMLDDKRGKFLVKDGQGYRKARPSDVAILLHSTTNQMLYEKALRALGLPYSIAKVSRSMTLEAVCNDIYSFLQLLVHPSDRVAYHGVLRSPFCRLDDDKVQEVMARRDVFNPKAIGDPVYLGACELYATLKTMCRTHTLTSLLDYLWYASGYRLSLLSYPSFQSYLDHYYNLRQMASEAELQGKGLSEFLDDLRPTLGKASKIELSSSEGILEENQNGVKIMTIHASKGLEFPIVFVPDLAYALSRLHQESDAFTKVCGHSIPEYVACTVPDPIVKALRLDEEEKRQKIAEEKRLCYVAMTRAEQHLVISGTYRKNKKDEEEKPDETLLGWALSALGLERGHILSLEEEEERPDGITLKKIKPVSEKELRSERAFSSVSPSSIDSWYHGKPFQPDLDPARIAVTRYIDEDKVENGEKTLLRATSVDEILGDDNDLVTGFGTYVHARTMQMMGIYQKERSRDELADQSFGKLEGTIRKKVLDAGDELANGFIESDFYRKQVEPYLATTRAEVHLFFHPSDAQNPDLVVEGQIDILIQKPDGWEILDFKTDKYRLREGHKEQVALYRDALRQIVHSDKIRMAIVYLRDPEKVDYWD